jgi:LPXTG-motif cell wall-anchored protein
MKKLIAILFIAALAVFGASPAFAVVGDDQGDNDQGGVVSDDLIIGTPEQCAESDTTPTNVICDAIEGSPDIYPVEEPEGGTVPEPTTTVVTPPGELPKTGSSGSIGLVQIGGLMLAGGLLVVVASRRRAPAPTA